MAKKHDILYINFYTSGSAAHKIDLAPPQTKQPAPVAAPKARPRKRQVVYVDPLAVASIVVSAVMLVLMLVGMVTLNEANVRQARLEAYLERLQTQNAELQVEFEEKYDPEAIEKAALALGMVPVEQVEHRTIYVEPVVVPEAEPNFWEQLQTFFDGLFA